MIRYIIILLLCSCSMLDQQHIEVDKAFYNYYESFLNEAQNNGLDYSQHQVLIYFAETNKDAYTHHGEIPKIRVNRKFWESIGSEPYKKYVIWHELGHAFLKRGHEQDSSYMAYGITGQFIRNNQNYLDEELFSR